MADIHADGAGGPQRGPDVGARIKRTLVHMVADQGVAGLDVASVCARADVSEAAFYRRWDDLWAAALDALDERSRLPALPDEGSLIGDLVAYTQAYMDLCGRPEFTAFVFNLMTAARADPALRRRLGPGFQKRRRVNRALIERAVARGELTASVDGDAILDGVLRLCFGWMGAGATPSRREVRAAVERLIAPGFLH